MSHLMSLPQSPVIAPSFAHRSDFAKSAKSGSFSEKNTKRSIQIIDVVGIAILRVLLSDNQSSGMSSPQAYRDFTYKHSKEGQLIIHTDKGYYHPGEVVTGMVLLKVRATINVLSARSMQGAHARRTCKAHMQGTPTSPPPPPLPPPPLPLLLRYDAVVRIFLNATCPIEHPYSHWLPWSMAGHVNVTFSSSALRKSVVPKLGSSTCAVGERHRLPERDPNVTFSSSALHNSIVPKLGSSTCAGGERHRLPERDPEGDRQTEDNNS
jgi:hypothetical protein